MKLKYIFILIFCAISFIPSFLFLIWPYSKAMELEMTGVRDRHLVIAKNLAVGFERYYQDITTAFLLLSEQFNNKDRNKLINHTFKTYDFQSILLIDKNSGQVKDCISLSKLNCPEKISSEKLSFSKSFLEPKKANLSTVTTSFLNNGKNSTPVFLAVTSIGSDIIIGSIPTKYIIKLGNQVSFGEQGHAAVVDQAGNIIAHPFNGWISASKNISKLEIVQKMMAGQTGVEVFFSPALQADMIAGYTAVSNAGWGVMVPQPLAELQNKADSINSTALVVILLGLASALIISIPVSFILTRPLERLSTITTLIGNDNHDSNVKLETSIFSPKEITILKKNFQSMLNSLNESKEIITRIAYVDSNTNLPNRDYFRLLADYALNKMINENKKGAMIFIDLDNFKKVNDTYGHKKGDELIKSFSQRLLKHISTDKRCTTQWLNNSIPCTIPARVGGDEFVILLRNIITKEDVKILIEKIQSVVFGHYELNGNINLNLSGSIGVALFPEHGATYDSILESADLAMYAAKKINGDNIFHFYNT